MRRLLAALAAGVVAVVLAPVVGKAEATTECQSMTWHWSVQSGSIDINVAWIELTIEVCSNGNQITTTQAWIDHDETGPGTAAGFVLHSGAPDRVSFDSGDSNTVGQSTYYTGASLKDCIPKITLVCSPAMDFSVRGQVKMMIAGWQGPLDPSHELWVHGRAMIWSWWWVCKNDDCQNCGVKLNGNCKP